MIPRQTIEEIKARTDIVELIGSYLPLKRAGSAFKACCPFHKEKTPSFQVNPQRQIYHCFGCGKGGGVIQFLMDYEGLDFVSAVKQLAERVNVPLEFEENGFAAGRRDEKAKLLKIHELIAAHFHHLLRKAPEAAEARAYLASRNIDEEIIKHFHFGFAPERWDMIEPWGAKQNITPEDLAAAGLLVKSDRPGTSPYYDRFRNRLMIPIRDEQGRVIAFTGRILSKDEQNAKYVNSPETILFQKSRVLFALDAARRNMADRKHAILCEGQIDAIRCHQAGFTNTIASQGTAITEAHARIIKRYCDDVILVLDPDSAGQNAALRAYEVFLEHDLNVRVARLPEGKDPDSLISSAGPEAFQHALDTAVSALPFQIQLLQAR
ncbi:MAG: DNA primase, partial [Kiritimatiellae bacterium]|nr:DNA primase [Kiritimatiellia bacterium]